MPPVRSARQRRLLERLFAGGVTLLILGLAGCSGSFSWNPLNWFRSPPPVVIPWDSISPPPLTAALDSLEPSPIPIGMVPAPGRYDQDLDVLHYDVELVVPPENDRISSRTTIRYMRQTAGPHELTLDLSGLSVELVTAAGAPLPFTQDNGLLRIDSPGRPGVFDTIQVEIMAKGVPDDGFILGDNTYGEPTAFADNWPNRARFWFPSNDYLDDKATVGFTVHAQAGRRVVANGVEIGQPVAADSARVGGLPDMWTWRWENRVPIPTYMMVVGVADLEVLDLGTAACGMAPASPRPDGCIDVTAWAFPQDSAYARALFARAPQMVDLYTQLFGPFPFEKLANVESTTRFSGMENASAIFYADEYYARRTDIEGTVAHEIVHQWFGDSVTPASWSDLWLSEGFADYFGAVFWAQTLNDEAFRQRVDGFRRAFLGSGVASRPVVDDGVTNLLDLLNANSYQKGALILHMLRNVVGERAFFDGIRQYYRTYAGRWASTADFRAVMEQVSGQSLDWFFNQWLRRPGYPILRVEWGWDDDLGQAQVRVVQEQDPLWPTFRLPMVFEFRTEGGVHRVEDWVDGREWTRQMALPSRPSELRVDPDGWLLLEAEVDGP